MPVPVKLCAAGPPHHEGVGVGQQGDGKAFAPQPQQGIKVALKQFGCIPRPGIFQLFHRQCLAHDAAQLVAVLLGGEYSGLQVAEDAFLGIIVEKFLDPCHADFLEPLDGNHLVKAENNAAQVKHDVHLIVVGVHIVPFLKNHLQR